MHTGMKYHILHLVLSMDTGGAERVISYLVTEQPGDHVQQTVCCLDNIGPLGEDLRAKGYHVDLLSRQDGIDWKLVLKIYRFCRKNNIDLIHTHGESPWFYGALAANLVPWKRIPCITTIHGYGGGDRQNMQSYRLWKILTALSRKVILVSNVLHRELLHAGLSTKKLQTVVNGIPAESMHHSPDRNPELRKVYNIQPDDFVVGIVARLSAIKNHALLLYAVKQLQKTTEQQVRLLIVGDGPERPKLERLANDLQLKPEVTFCGKQTNVDTFYNLFDVFVLPSFSEGISMAILEAMAAGIPVIASAVGGNEEIISHEHNGLLFPSNDLDALVRRLRRLLDDPQAGLHLVANALTTISTTFSLKTMLQAYRKIYTDILHKKYNLVN